MALTGKVTPASIEFVDANGVTTKLFFHEVISEDHEARATVTKYPVQTGFHVTNHSIRNNMKVTLEGLMSDVQILGASNYVEYGARASKNMYHTLQDLVNSGIECKVTTNLRIYNPVIFTGLKTKQGAGMLDSMLFNLTGEEIIKVDTKNKTAPNILYFNEPDPSLLPAIKDFLTETVNMKITNCSKIETTEALIGEDFMLTGKDAQGNTVTTTYLYKGRDGTTGEPIYEIHISENSVPVVDLGEAYPTEATAGFCAKTGFQNALLASLEQIGGCLLNEAVDALVEAIDDAVTTAIGKLKNSIYGYVYDITNFDSAGGSLLARAGIGCVVRGALRTPDDGTTWIPGESLPTTEQILSGASQGLGFTERPPQLMTLTQITCQCEGEELEDISLSDIPII